MIPLSDDLVFESRVYLLGYKVNCLSAYSSEYLNIVRDNMEVNEMPHYPSKGYICDVDGYIVVKLSD